ncbi:MAG: c-type cytochrome [Chloroflexi bacterium]|nr:c-type cytochrome [Chloroflexota bacterium]
MKRYLKWAGLAFGGVLALLVILILILTGIGSIRVNKTFDIQVVSIDVPTDSASLERGRLFVETVGICQECHGENYEGKILGEDLLFGRLAPPNLTSGKGGIGGSLTDIDYVRAIRHGVDRDGKALLLMPSEAFNKISDEDMGAMIAYLKSVPPVDNEVPQSSARLLARILTVFDDEALFAANKIDHDAPRPSAPSIGVTVEYGEYLATVCTICHGENLAGGSLPDDFNVSAPNLTPAGVLGVWTESDFISTIRTGVTPGRNKLDEEDMPWKRFRMMSDDELKAIWLYLQSVPPAALER